MCLVDKMTDKEIYVIKEVDDKLFVDKWDKKHRPLMKCGHTASATTEIPNSDGTGTIKIYCCASCFGITEDGKIIDNQPDLTGRKAKCSYCDKVRDSSFDLPFFSYQPDKEFDNFYCGCMGWD